MVTNTHILALDDHLNQVRMLLCDLPEGAIKDKIKLLIESAIDNLMELNADVVITSRKMTELVDRVATLSRSLYEPVLSGQYVYPAEGDYNAVREYVENRRAKDEVFNQYCIGHSRKQLCDRLSDEFGWVLDVKSYSRNVQRH